MCVCGCLPNCLGHWPCGLGALEDVTSESLHCRMLCDEPNEAMIARMKRAERDILKRVEVIDAGFLLLLVLLKSYKR